MTAGEMKGVLLCRIYYNDLLIEASTVREGRTLTVGGAPGALSVDRAPSAVTLTPASDRCTIRVPQSARLSQKGPAGVHVVYQPPRAFHQPHSSIECHLPNPSEFEIDFMDGHRIWVSALFTAEDSRRPEAPRFTRRSLAITAGAFVGTAVIAIAFAVATTFRPPPSSLSRHVRSMAELSTSVHLRTQELFHAHSAKKVSRAVATSVQSIDSALKAIRGLDAVLSGPSGRSTRPSATVSASDLALSLPVGGSPSSGHSSGTGARAQFDWSLAGSGTGSSTASGNAPIFSEIQKRIVTRMAEVRRCYEQALLKDPSLSGLATIELSLTASGSVETVQVTIGEKGQGGALSVFDQCLTTLFGGDRFDQVKERLTLRFRVLLTT